MPLHRDIHWLGRQWAVTGHGLQLINQKQMGYYDIEAARLWDARVTEVQTKAWIDRPDFDHALELARARFAELAPADFVAPAAVAPPPPPVRPPPPAAPRAPLDAASVPSIEELLARLKSRTAAAPPVAKPAEEAPAPPPLEPEPPKPALVQAAPVAPELPEPESPTFEAPKAEPAKPEPLQPEVRQAAPAEPKAQAAPKPLPVLMAVRRSAGPAWPVFDRKIAGSARFVRPWRVTSTRWQGPAPGLPPRP